MRSYSSEDVLELIDSTLKSAASIQSPPEEDPQALEAFLDGLTFAQAVCLDLGYRYVGAEPGDDSPSWDEVEQEVELTVIHLMMLESLGLETARVYGSGQLVFYKQSKALLNTLFKEPPDTNAYRRAEIELRTRIQWTVQAGLIPPYLAAE